MIRSFWTITILCCTRSKFEPSHAEHNDHCRHVDVGRGRPGDVAEDVFALGERSVLPTTPHIQARRHQNQKWWQEVNQESLKWWENCELQLEMNTAIGSNIQWAFYLLSCGLTAEQANVQWVWISSGAMWKHALSGLSSKRSTSTSNFAGCGHLCCTGALSSFLCWQIVFLSVHFTSAFFSNDE